MKTLTDFALKEENKCLQSVEDKLAKIGSLIDWKFLVPFLTPYILTKQFFEADLKLMLYIMFKMFFLQQ